MSLLTWLLLAATSVADDPAPPADLAAFLAARGYAAVPMQRQVLNHLQVDAVIDGHPVRLLVDTGATSSVLDRAVVAGWEVPLADAQVGGFGIGSGMQQVGVANVGDLRIGPIATGPMVVFATDLSSVRAAVVAMGGQAPDGLLGADFLARYAAVIEVGTSTLFLDAAAGQAPGAPALPVSPDPSRTSGGRRPARPRP